MRIKELIPSLFSLVTLEVDLFRPVRTGELIIKTHFKSYQLPLLLLLSSSSCQKVFTLSSHPSVLLLFLLCSTSLCFASNNSFSPHFFRCVCPSLSHPVISPHCSHLSIYAYFCHVLRSPLTLCSPLSFSSLLFFPCAFLHPSPALPP